MSEDDRAEVTSATSASGGWRIVNFDLLKQPPDWLAAFIYVIGTIFLITVLVMVGIGLIAAFRIGYETSTGEFKDRVEAGKVFLPILIALIGGPLLIWRVVTAHIQAWAARQQAEIAREAHYTDLFTKAVEQLGATRETKRYILTNDEADIQKRELVNETEPNLEVRLGAIYALERIAYDSERDHWPIMEVLCAYVRQNSGKALSCPISHYDTTREEVNENFLNNPRTDEESLAMYEWLASLPPPRSDVQAALTVIGRRSAKRRAWEKAKASVDGHGIDIQTEYRLDLHGANLSRMNIVGNFDVADFHDSSLDGATFYKTRLDDALFQGASLIGATIRGGSLVESAFHNARIDLAELTSCDMRRCKFVRTHAESAEFGGSDFEAAEFTFSMFYNSSFMQASLTGAEFEQSNLGEAKFWWARLDGIKMKTTRVDGASFQDASLYRADLSSAEGLTGEQLEEVYEADITTKLPQGMLRPAGWEDQELTDLEITARIRERDESITESFDRSENEVRT